MKRQTQLFTVIFTTLAFMGHAFAQEAEIKKRLLQRIPNFPAISTVTKSPMKGLYEVVTVEPEIFYTDKHASYLMRGDLIDLRTKKNLTEDHMEALLAIPFVNLPLKDAFTLVRGDGKRKIAIFEDPNCVYCKRFEADLQKITNITVYLFLYPILGTDSTEKSKHIWCAKSRSKAWQDWMLKNTNTPPSAPNCDITALDRNVKFGKKYKITGTPTIIFANGSRTTGAVRPDQLDAMLKKRS